MDSGIRRAECTKRTFLSIVNGLRPSCSHSCNNGAHSTRRYFSRWPLATSVATKLLKLWRFSDRIEGAVEDAIILIAPTSQVNTKITSLDSPKLYRDATGSGTGMCLGEMKKRSCSLNRTVFLFPRGTLYKRSTIASGAFFDGVFPREV